MVQVNEKRYFSEIDWGKAVGITLVVMGHFLLGGTSLKILFYTVHVPLFFVISGFLFSPNGIISFIQKRFKRLIIPYALYTVLCLPFYLHNDKGVEVTQLVRKIWYLDGFPVWNDALWFLPTLFSVEVLFCLIWYAFSFCTKLTQIRPNIIEKAAKKPRTKRCTFSNTAVFLLCAVLIVASYFWGFWLEQHEVVKFYFGLNKTVQLMGFYVFGVLLRQTDILHKLRYSAGWKIGVAFAAAGLGLTAVLINKGASVSLLYCNYGGNWKFYMPLAVLLSLGVLWLFRNVKLSKAAALLSHHSLFIMCTHYFFLKLWQMLVGRGFWLDLAGGAVTVGLYLCYLAVWEPVSEYIKKLYLTNK